MSVIDKDHYKDVARQTPFHPRLSKFADTNEWTRWKSYTVATTFENVEYEYFALRNTCGVFDITPMNKYSIRGRDAEGYLNRLLTRDITKLKPGRVAYAVWCNDQGKVIDDGTIFHLTEGEYRLCAQEHQLDWLMISALGFDVEIEDVTDDVAALALQGPTSFANLREMGLSGIEAMKPFGLATFPFEGGELMVSRTGFTGDLGYELWVTPDLAIPLWDKLFAAGAHRGIRPIGGDALEMARIEAGFIQAGSDFMPANETVRLGHDRSPLELDLGWLVDFKKPNFTGRRALMQEKKAGSKHRLVRLNIEGNKPAHSSYIYLGKGKKEIGVVTSAVWSPTCKANLALTSLLSPYGKPGDDLWAEIYYQRELGWKRMWARCEVVDSPFWNPPRRRATPPSDF